MAIPTVQLSTDSQLRGYANDTDSILEIRSMLHESHIIQFLAFLTSMDQSFDSTWNTEDVFGRNDPIAIFQGTKRTISLAFTLVAGTIEEARLNLRKVDVLTSFLYPSYRKVPGRAEEGLEAIHVASYMNGSPLVKVKFANLINSNLSGHHDGLMGYISSLSVSPSLDAGTFIEDYDHYPKIIEISFSLNVLHQQTPGWDTLGNWLGEKHMLGNLTAPTEYAPEPSYEAMKADVAAGIDKIKENANTFAESRTGQQLLNDPTGLRALSGHFMASINKANKE